jgi:hypothetical protein
MTKHYKMIKPVLVILLFSVVLVIGACKKVDYHQLSDEDMSWLVYKNNQVDVFSNGSSQSVSYKVSIRTKSYYDNGDVANEFTTASFRQVNDTTAIVSTDSEGLLYIYKQDDDGLLVTFSWPHFPIKGIPLTSLPPNVVTVGGILYNDVFILDGSGLTDIRFYISKIWYSKSEGVIQYEDTSGDVWIRSI